MTKPADKRRDSYQVGYGKPPLHTRFGKGISGNPTGKRRHNNLWDTNQFIMEEACRSVSVRDGDKIIKIPTIRAVLRSLFLSAVKGNGPAQRAIIKLVPETAAELSRLEMEKMSNLTDEELVESFDKMAKELGYRKIDA